MNSQKQEIKKMIKMENEQARIKFAMLVGK